jgi:repressor LexA
VQPLTDRQDLILQFIRHSIRERGYPPTLREIGAQMGIRSTNGVSDHLRALERKGYLRREDMKSRALRPVEDDTQGGHHAANDSGSDDGGDTVSVPVLGRVAAGPLSLTSDSCDSRIAVDRSVLRGAVDVFGLKVKGDSMIDAGILDGDTIFVRRTQSAEKDHVRLQPENKRLAPILVRRGDAAGGGFEILGVVVGLFRSIGDKPRFGPRLS